MKQIIKELLSLVEPLAKEEGYNSTNIPRLKIIKYSHTQRIDNVYEPSFCVVLQGQKHTILNDEIYKYQSGDYIIASALLPVTGQILAASKEKPFIAIVIELDALLVVEILKDLPRIQQVMASSRALYVSNVEEQMLEALRRFLACLKDSDETIILAPLIMKEILFRLLMADSSGVLRQLGMVGAQAGKVRLAINEIVNNFTNKININDLATKVGMSPSSFHQHFKDVTAMSPLQYQKNVRLMEARRLLLTGDEDAASIAYRVGYESPSQFSREYARFYGLPPINDREKFKVSLPKK